VEAVAGKVEGLEAGHGQAGDAGQLQGGCVNVLKRVCSRDVRLMLTRLGLKRQVMDRLRMQDSCHVVCVFVCVYVCVCVCVCVERERGRCT